MKNYYETLGVNQYSSEGDIRKAYFKLAKAYHPDVNSSNESEGIFKGINEAYAVLSDSLRRADYDQMLERNFVKEKMEKARDEKPHKDEEKPQSARMQFAAAFGRTLFSVFVGALAGFLIEFIIWYLTGSKNTMDINSFYPSIAWGGILGLFWGADLNFDVEEFFGPGYLGRTYTFLRTFVYAMSFAFLFGRFFGIFSSYFKSNIPSLFGVTLGTVFGGAIGSQGNGIFMLKEDEGRFNLFYAAIRAILIGIIVAAVALFLGVTLEFVAGVNITLIAAFVGFILGVIFGSISPPNLSAYASYASSAVKNSMIIIVAVFALLIGAIIAYLFHNQIDKIITRIF